MKGLIIFIFGVMLMAGCFADERPVTPADQNVRVTFQLKQRNGNSWTTSNATLKGAVSESMMINEISRRYPNMQVRILAASCGKEINVSVRYQTSRDGNSWTSGSATLKNALTESMARNQISQKYPNTKVRILSMTPDR